MSADQNRQTALDFIAALAKLDVARFAALMTDDATYWINGKPDRLPIAGTMTKAKLIEFIEGSAGKFEPGFAINVHGTTAEGDRVAVEAESDGMAFTGKRYTTTYHFLFTFRDGKISGIREHLDTLHVADTFNVPLS